MFAFFRRLLRPRSTDYVGWNTVWHEPDPLTGERRKYFLRVWVGQLRLHVFYTGDPARDHHDHPWPFWTFPLVSYVEETFFPHMSGKDGFTHRAVVHRFKLHRREATHAHKVLGAWSGQYGLGDHGFRVPVVKPGRIVTLVWSGPNTANRRERIWGFWRRDDAGKLCWMPWERYILGGGRSQPCE